jgi:transcriptional regulator NrdR family protein
MTAYELELIAMAKNRGDSLSRQLADTVKKQNEQIEALKLRELTEDEIREVADSVCHAWKKNGVGEIYMTDFARAILKKASEK